MIRGMLGRGSLETVVTSASVARVHTVGSVSLNPPSVNLGVPPESQRCHCGRRPSQQSLLTDSSDDHIDLTVK
jgi:hypothetical protein